MLQLYTTDMQRLEEVFALSSMVRTMTTDDVDTLNESNPALRNWALAQAEEFENFQDTDTGFAFMLIMVRQYLEKHGKFPE
jgi:hypothetical protein